MNADEHLISSRFSQFTFFSRMRLVTYSLILWLVSGFSHGCHPAKTVAYEPASEEIAGVIDAMNQLMMHDITNPPLASRFFAYTLLAGYEILAQSDSTLRPLTKALRNYPVISKPADAAYNPKLAALFAMLETARRIQPSGQQLAGSERNLVDEAQKQGVTVEEVQASQAQGHAVADAVVKYAKQDGYSHISDYPRYSPTKGAGYWFPTPPSFLAAVEPYFNTLRPFVLDSASAFKPIPPIAFQTSASSAFRRQMADVCRAGQQLTLEQKAIAAFWDCNPFAVQDAGHLQVGLKKMSPGAHWMKIASTVCRQSRSSFEKTLLVHTALAVTMMDAFICCWDEKYRSNRVRPETVIRQYIDPTWKPLLQTPPFPEYLSGHSVISAASAEVLTHFFGDNVAYTDSTELRFGLPPRRFSSFRQAALEAGMSRFYGGIHFMDSVVEGLKQGEKLGAHVVKALVPQPGNAHRTITVTSTKLKKA